MASISHPSLSRPCSTDELEFLEKELLFLRRGKNGTEQRQCELVAALFQHSSSRLADPDLHTHALVFNAGHADGRWNAIDARYIYRWKMALGALYRTQLVHELWQTIGLSFDRIKTWVELKGIVPERLIRYFSKRSKELREAMRLHGADSARASDIASLRTRKAKRIIPRPELFRQWRREARALGFGSESVEALLESGAIGQASEGFEAQDGLMPLLTNALHGCIEEITAFRSHFPRRLLIETFLPRATEFKVSADVALQIIDDVLQFDAGVMELVELEGELRFATPKTVAQETSLKRHVSTLNARPGRVVPNDVKRKTMLAHSHLAMEQLNGLDYLIDGQGCIKGLVGVPGGGKTQLLKAAFDAWTDVGMKVIGCSIMGRAARNLEHKSGISSSTVRRLQLDLERASELKGNLAGPQPICGLPTYRFDGISLDEKTVVVVDEAGMVSTADALDLLTKVVDAGATLLLVGDENQLPPIGAGAPFEAIIREITHASLSQIRRFDNPADREALRLITEGKPEPALQLYADRGLFVVEESPHAVREKVVTDFVHQGGINSPQDHLILVGTNAQRKDFNDQIQKLRQEAGLVASEGTVVRGEFLATGDRVMFLRNDRRLGVNNGDIGTISASDDPLKHELNVTMDSGRTVKVSLKSYDDLTRAYAATVHKTQGGEVPFIYAVIGGRMQSMELTVTQLSRHQIICCIYTDKIEAGENLERLHRQIRTPARECLAIDLLARKEAKVPPPDGELAVEKKITTPIRHRAVECPEDSAKLTIAKRNERSASEATENKLGPDQPPQRAGWVSLKRNDAERSSTQSGSEGAIPKKEQLAADSSQRPYVRISPPVPQLEQPQASAPRQSDRPQPVVAVDDRKTQAQAVDKPPCPSDRSIDRLAEKSQIDRVEPEPQRIRLASGDANGSKLRNETASDGVGKQIVQPALPELRDAVTASNLSEPRNPPLHPQAADPLRDPVVLEKPAVLPQLSNDGPISHSDWTTAQRPPLASVASKERSTSDSTNSSESRDTNPTAFKQRLSETMLEQEQRIAREERAKKIHEHHFDPQIDPTRSGPKPT